MRRMICFLMAMAMLMMVPCTVLAANTNSIGNPIVTPQTGDSIMLWIVLLVAAVVLLAVAVIFRKKMTR